MTVLPLAMLYSGRTQATLAHLTQPQPLRLFLHGSLWALLFLATAWPVLGQTVVVVRGVPPLAFGTVAAADYDGDGDDDLVLVGQRLDGSPLTGVYRFNARLVEPIARQAPRIVADHSQVSFPARRFKAGHTVWADVDGDGDQDLIMTGTAVDDIDITQVIEQPATDLFENNGQTLLIRNGSGLPPLRDSKASWADFDKDGDLDLVLTGLDTAGERFLGLFEHDGAFRFSPVQLDLPQMQGSDMAWGDFDGDGDQDLLVVGVLESGPGSLLLVHESDNSFRATHPNLPAQFFAAIDAGDFDGDGDDDLVMSGGVIGVSLMSGVSEVYRSDGGSFTPISSGLAGVFAGDVSWGDIDGDGALDLLLSGITDLESPDNQRAYLFQQQRGTFVEVISFQGVLFGSTIWYDYNSDGRLDILTTGIQDDGLIMTLFEF